MKKITLLIPIIFMVLLANVFGQKASITLTFSAVNNTQYVLLDSVYIENLTQGGDTTIVAPNSSLLIENVGIDDVSIENQTMTLSQNYPNPIRQQSNINLFLQEKDDITIRIHNLIGQEVTSFEGKLSNGNHSFTFYPGNEDTYLLTAFTSSGAQSIKMVNIKRKGNKQCKIVYSGNSNNANAFKSLQSTMGFVFSYGDELRYIGYAKTTEQFAGADVIEDAPQMDESYEFEISEGMPCQEELYVMYEGQQYNTVQVGNQCWLKENLNVGTRIDGEYGQVDNGLIEKYCYNDEEDSCTAYGALYQWKEMMQYGTSQGVQGICPDGWHIPTDAEWCALTQLIDPTVDCDDEGESGTDVGSKMKSTSGWMMDGNGTDNFGFTVLPSGYRYPDDGVFGFNGQQAHLWSSTKDYTSEKAWFRKLTFDDNSIFRYNDNKDYGFQVRCVKGTQWVCGDTIHDSRNDMVYSTVDIGGQCWMAENLNVGTFIYDSVQFDNNDTIEKYCYFNEEDSCDIYGGLYRWDEMMGYTTLQGSQGICPVGWHVPTDDEWTILTDFCGGIDVAGGVLKEEGTLHWDSPNTGATNEYGFTALPGGNHLYYTFYHLGNRGHCWSSTEDGNSQAWTRGLWYNTTEISVGANDKDYSFTIRCLKD